MKTNWDYTDLADAYIKRPDYSVSAIDSMLSIVGANKNTHVCDVGAGVGHLSLMLAEKVKNIIAVEPNNAMRSNGINRTKIFSNIYWYEGVGESTGQNEDSFELVTFGSSFNVCERNKALIETARILKPNGWFVCMWNHRELNDPIQSKIEKIIKSQIEGYGYGTRRQDQKEVINSSNLFGPVIHIDSVITHTQKIEDCKEAWASHATLQRQAGDKFKLIIKEIEELLNSFNTNEIKIPYSTNIWLAQLK